jgi:hypothetical protein
MKEFQKRLLRRICVSKKGGIAGDRGKLHDEGLHS